MSVWPALLRIGSLALAGLVAACATTPPGLPLTDAVVRSEGDAEALAAARGETRFVVRTMIAEPSGLREAPGASCRAVTSLSRSEFVSPARVGLPDLGADSPVVTVACDSGDLSGTAAGRPVVRNRSAAVYPAIGLSVGTGGYGTGGVGVSFGGLWTAGPNPPFSELSAEYPDIEIVLR